MMLEIYSLKDYTNKLIEQLKDFNYLLNECSDLEGLDENLDDLKEQIMAISVLFDGWEAEAGTINPNINPKIK